jgi:hypothetical protein
MTVTVLLALLAGTELTVASPATTGIDARAARFCGEWVDGKRRILILPKAGNRITVKTHGLFLGEAGVSATTVLVADEHQWGKPTDDLTTTCALELSLLKEAIQVRMAGDRSDCDLDYEGLYRKKR